MCFVAERRSNSLAGLAEHFVDVRPLSYGCAAETSLNRLVRELARNLQELAAARRLGPAASAAALLLVEVVYVGVHAKPLAPLLPGRGRGRADRGFLETYTTAAFFGSELALFALLGLASPAR